MSSKIPLKELAEVWCRAANFYDESKFFEAAEQFETVAADSTAKISYNLGCIYLKMKQHQKSLEKFQNAVTKDTHFVAAYVQMAVIYLEYNMCDAAIKCYEVAVQLMGNKKYINYRPLGLNLILYLTQVLHNQAVAESKVDNWKQVEVLMNMAISAQQEDKFNNKLKLSLQNVQQKLEINEFHIETGIFHPPKWMIENAKINYLGDSKVISTNNNPFSMNGSNSSSKPANDELWPSIKEQDVEQKKQLKSVIAMLTTITLSPTEDESYVDKKVKQRESKLGTDGKPQRPPRPPPKAPPIRPPLPPRIVGSQKLQQQKTNNDLNSQDNTNAPLADYKKVGRTVFVKYGLLSSNPNILAVREGDKIVVKALGADWFQGCLKNKIGLVPWNCIYQR